MSAAGKDEAGLQSIFDELTRERMLERIRTELDGTSFEQFVEYVF